MKEQKKGLLEEAEFYKKAIKGQVNQSVEDLQKKGVSLLIVGGAVLVGFALIRMLTSSSKDKQTDPPPPTYPPYENAPAYGGYPPPPQAPPQRRKKDSYLIRMLKQQATSLLMEVAKQTLKDFIGNINSKSDSGHTGQNGQSTQQKEDN